MPRPSTILFLQLPLLDNDVFLQPEEVRLAETYLTHALRTSPERDYFRVRTLSPADSRRDDRGVIAAIRAQRPDILACTLYLWNVERTLDMAARLKSLLPCLVILGGGPEVAPDHPFLFSRKLLDAAAVGAGEVVFPLLLRALRNKTQTDFRNVAWPTARGYRWGRQPPPERPLRDILPPADSRLLKPDRHGVAYLETVRGCPLRCTYCCYSQHGRQVMFLPAIEAVARVRALRRKGAREIRIIDPTFNAHPEFEEILKRLACLNRRSPVRFFAEVRPDTLTPKQIGLLKRAGFAEVEIGIQSTQPRVLKAIRRPSGTKKVEAVLQGLAQQRIRVTLDLMYGLPLQTLADIRSSLRWAIPHAGVRVQCLQTLLLPGTALRATSDRFGLQALPTPPYSVQQTARLNRDAFVRAENLIETMLGTAYDCPTPSWIGTALPDLFRETLHWHADRDRLPQRLPGKTNRRVLILHAEDFFEQRQRLRQLVRQALITEPHILWQFILAVRREEPLDVLDALIAEIFRSPPLVQDHMLGARHRLVRAGRRIRVRLARGRRFDPDWKEAVSRLLAARFY